MLLLQKTLLATFFVFPTDGRFGIPFVFQTNESAILR
jgi:hypothetical protein